MKTISLLFTSLCLFISVAQAQVVIPSPCSHEEIVSRHLAENPNVLADIEAQEAFTKAFMERLKTEGRPERGSRATYIIPVVLHVFHFGDDGKIDMEQAQSGIDVLNDDFNGFNDSWDSIDAEFDSIKGTLDIQFCLASIDPDGNPTTGVNYYEDENALNNEGDLFQYSWDNYKYLNIYMPKYVFGGPSNFTAYAYYPNTLNSDNQRDGVFYSSIRWGYGTHSELNPGQDWASVGTHEIGHWLNLRHTFENGCGGSGDSVDDTPPSTGGTIELEGCYNNNLSCGVATNGSNFMDYNHDCKRMFTQGQVDRMTAALSLPARITLWSPENLMATGCLPPITNTQDLVNDQSAHVYPNPARDHISFAFPQKPIRFLIRDSHGKLIYEAPVRKAFYDLNLRNMAKGIYFYYASYNQGIANGKFIVN